MRYEVFSLSITGQYNKLSTFNCLKYFNYTQNNTTFVYALVTVSSGIRLLRVSFKLTLIQRNNS